MVRPMFGGESEYAIAGVNGREPGDHDDLANRFVLAAGRRLPHLQDAFSASGMFLENGARFYIDCGFHPEMTTPECTTPWELVRYIKAGERILEELARQVQAEACGATEIMCFRCNVDYSGSGSTWGCHESYLHRADPATLPEQLIPHLVTRVIYTGAGGFNPLVNWPEFSVAPRLLHIQRTVSSDSTGNRGIFHTKNEPLAGDGYNRLHILSGESLCSETAIVLKIGTTALVAAMAEAGLKPGAGLALASPIEALHAVSSDVTCKRKLTLAAGGEATAIDIQRRLLELAERNRGVLPSWTEAICALWRITLDQLEGAPDSVATVLDWAIKRRLFHDRAERRGIPMERFPCLSSIIHRLNVALAEIGVKSRGVRLSSLLAPESPIPREVARIGTTLAAENLSWDDCQGFMAKLQEKTGRKFVLPTEAQWEYACRAGTTGDYAGNLDAMAWYNQNSGGTTHPVGQKQPNAWGLYDMHGNVWEWCRDWYGNYPGGSVTDPTGPPQGSLRVIRGGCWGFVAGYCRSAFRGRIDPGIRYVDLGFRLALAP